MKYFWMLFDSGNEYGMVADIVDFKGVQDYDVCSGRFIDQWDCHSYVAVGDKGRVGRPDDVLQAGTAALIFSNRLRTTLEQAGIHGIQYLPIQILRSDEPPLDSFAVANILNRLAVLDANASTLTRFSHDYFIEERRDAVSGLRRPVLRPSRVLKGVDIFRLQEYWPPVFVSQRFRDIYRLGGFTGAAFTEVPVTEP